MKWIAVSALVLAAITLPARADPPEKATLTIALADDVVGAELSLQNPESDETFKWKGTGDLLLPPGTYHVKALNVRFRPGKRKDGTCAIYGHTGERQKAVTVTAGKNRLTLGGPFDLRVEAVVWGPKADRLDIVDAHMAGADGLKYRCELYWGERPSRLRSCLRAGETTHEYPDLGYG
jgi:hypothetical protein